MSEFIQIEESFTRIGTKMRETLQTLKGVSGQIDSGSEQIGTIIGAIEDIASQTNLLSRGGRQQFGGF